MLLFHVIHLDYVIISSGHLNNYVISDGHLVYYVISGGHVDYVIISSGHLDYYVIIPIPHIFYFPIQQTPSCLNYSCMY